LKVGSYLQVLDDYDSKVLIAIIESFSIDIVPKKEADKNNATLDEFDRVYIIEASPLGIIEDGKFTRGGDTLSIPPKDVKPASEKYIKDIFEGSVPKDNQFNFSKLATNKSISVPVDGNKFFNKHLAIVGASGSGKSHTVAKIFQNAEALINEDNTGKLNNSHIVLFDIHSEYKNAFPNANLITISDLRLPYWLLNDEELEEVFLDSGDRNNYNQSSILRSVITENKRKHKISDKPVHFDSPVKFNLNEIINYLKNISKETVNHKSRERVMIKDGTVGTDLKTTENSGTLLSKEEKFSKYFIEELNFYEPKNTHISKGDYADGTLNKFLNRIESKVNDSRLSFLFGEESFNISFEDSLKNLIGYQSNNKSNVTIIDLSGVPFEVLSITVSLISRILFEFGYHKKKRYQENNTPLMLVYEEAHKYAPKSDMARFRSSINSIERIAKEGRKYGVTLCIVSQRPSEISETIFSQCNNFVAMRLTNPDDQNYVKRLLPDSLDGVTNSLPSLKTGEAIIIGDSIILPSIVKIDECSNDCCPSSTDINFLTEWKKDWIDIKFNELEEIWK
ncbi:MAG: ATP-binding protein, partial [Enterococcus sp.]|nr:ATP-binding protein [Enterococcus sp.]